eukprot:COSAG01_NODE_4257_length_5203_cov_10.296630_4_plen_73_part_00
MTTGRQRNFSVIRKGYSKSATSLFERVIAYVAHMNRCGRRGAITFENTMLFHTTVMKAETWLLTLKVDTTDK